MCVSPVVVNKSRDRRIVPTEESQEWEFPPTKEENRVDSCL